MLLGSPSAQPASPSSSDPWNPIDLILPPGLHPSSWEGKPSVPSRPFCLPMVIVVNSESLSGVPGTRDQRDPKSFTPGIWLVQHHPSETEGSVFAQSFQPEPHGKIAGLGEPCFHSAFTHSFSHKGMLSAWKVLNWRIWKSQNYMRQSLFPET